MLGSLAEPGVIPRFASDLFARIGRVETDDVGVWCVVLLLTGAQPSMRFKVEVSYFEIYSERIYDLLLPEARGNKTKVNRCRQLRRSQHCS